MKHRREVRALTIKLINSLDEYKKELSVKEEDYISENLNAKEPLLSRYMLTNETLFTKAHAIIEIIDMFYPLLIEESTCDRSMENLIVNQDMTAEERADTILLYGKNASPVSKPYI